MSSKEIPSEEGTAEVRSRHPLEAHGLVPTRGARWNLSPAHLYELALASKTGQMVQGGGLAVLTTPHTGRSPKDRFIVRDRVTADQVDWGEINAPLSEAHFALLRKEVLTHLNDQELLVRDARVGQDAAAGINVRVVTPSAWHDLFASNMFLRLPPQELAEIHPEFVILHAPELQADPARHGTRSGTFVVLSFAERTILIGGTRYAGEIKKSVFSTLNFLLPEQGILPMHCAANVGEEGDVALFFGLSGTGKTTLSADPARRLIGDDEHGWGSEGVFNFEGGCYAKVFRLSAKSEPEIHAVTGRFGTILENVVLDPRTRAIDFEDDSITENTRASYPVEFIPNSVPSGRGGHPSHVLFLTCDAFGVLPPISCLTPAQAMYHFLSGYTAKVAGTERGITEPEAVFSAGFGAPFLPRRAGEYARLLGEKLERHRSRVWLVNTGWTGGGTGVGSRIRLAHTRAMVHAALGGALDEMEMARDPIFGLHYPTRVPNVPPEILRPRESWPDPDEYDRAAHKLARMLADNFGKHRETVDPTVAEAGPR